MARSSHLYVTVEKNHSFDCMGLCQQSDVSLFNTCLLISWLQSQPAGIFQPKKIKSLIVFTFSPSICYEVMGLDAMIFVLYMYKKIKILFAYIKGPQ